MGRAGRECLGRSWPRPGRVSGRRQPLGGGPDWPHGRLVVGSKRGRRGRRRRHIHCAGAPDGRSGALEFGRLSRQPAGVERGPEAHGRLRVRREPANRRRGGQFPGELHVAIWPPPSSGTAERFARQLTRVSQLNRRLAHQKLLWIRLLARGGPKSGSQENDITPLSLNKRVITPDRRFKVQHRPPHKWLLSIENVGPADDKAYYLCQSGGSQRPAASPAPGATGQAGAANFIAGARLNVLMPPRLVEEETSPNLVSANEFEPFRLVCKVVGEPQAQIAWRREDGRPLDGLEQRFRHQLDRSQAHRLISIDSSELLFGPMRREQAGAYLVSSTSLSAPAPAARCPLRRADG